MFRILTENYIQRRSFIVNIHIQILIAEGYTSGSNSIRHPKKKSHSKIPLACTVISFKILGEILSSYPSLKRASNIKIFEGYKPGSEKNIAVSASDWISSVYFLLRILSMVFITELLEKKWMYF